MALSKLGEDSITALTEASEPGRQCNLVYVPIRNTVLRAFPWGFAIKRVQLAASSDAPVFGYTHKYALPSGCLKIVGFSPEADDIEYKVENGFILTDETSVYLRYVSEETNTNLYDPLFVEALAARIAAEIALPLTDSTSKMNAMFSLYDMKLSEAKSMSSQEGTPEQLIADGWINSRL